MKAPAGWFPGTKVISMILKMMSGLILENGKPSPSALVCVFFFFLSFFFFILITAQSLLFHISANQACSISAITTIKKHHMFNYLKISYKRKESDK